MAIRKILCNLQDTNTIIMIPVNCDFCKMQFGIPKYRYNRANRDGAKLFCGRKCMGLHKAHGTKVCKTCGVRDKYKPYSRCIECVNKQRAYRRQIERSEKNKINNLTATHNGILHTERWQSIMGQNGLYEISSFGRIKSFNGDVNKINGKILKPMICKGYYYIVLYGGDKKINMYVHRLVATHFIPNPENKPEVNHIGKDENGIITKLDNRHFSLEWVTRKENERHKCENGLSLKGEKSHLSKLKNKDILNIRASNKSAKELSKEYSVTAGHIRDIKNTKKWTHL